MATTYLTTIALQYDHSWTTTLMVYMGSIKDDAFDTMALLDVAGMDVNAHKLSGKDKNIKLVSAADEINDPDNLPVNEIMFNVLKYQDGLVIDSYLFRYRPKKDRVTLPKLKKVLKELTIDDWDVKQFE